MVDRITKYTDRLPADERRSVEDAMARIKRGDLAGLDVQKLKGHRDIYRARKGKTRLLFQERNGQYILLDVGRRSEKTYRGY